MLNFRRGFSYQNTGFSLLSAILSLVICRTAEFARHLLATGTRVHRQRDIRHPYAGVVHHHCLELLTAYAIKLSIVGGDEYLREADVAAFPTIRKTADGLSLYVVVICLINLVSVVLQCGLGERHTFNYKLLP
ncbi:MAG: hypothetical protein ABI580_06335 [Burkholderiaceae bacterium]